MTTLATGYCLTPRRASVSQHNARRSHGTARSRGTARIDFRQQGVVVYEQSRLPKEGYRP